MARRLRRWRTDQRCNAFRIDRTQRLGERGGLGREGIIPNGRIAEFIDHLQQPTARAVAVDVDLHAEITGSSLGCGWAMLQILAGVNPASVATSHGPGIEPCRCDGDIAFDA